MQELLNLLQSLLGLAILGFAVFWVYFQFFDRLTVEKIGRAVLNDLAAGQPEAWRAKVLSKGYMSRWAFRKASIARINQVKAEIARRSQS